MGRHVVKRPSQSHAAAGTYLTVNTKSFTWIRSDLESSSFPASLESYTSRNAADPALS